MEKEELFSKRLVLRPVTEAQANDLWKYFDKKVTRYMTPRPPRNYEEAQASIRRFIDKWESETTLMFGIFLRETGEFLGCVSLHSVKQPVAEIAIWTKAEAAGNRYGQEAVVRLMAYAFKSFGYRALVYPVDKRNGASKRIPLSVGGKIVKKEISLSRSFRLLFLENYEITAEAFEESEPAKAFLTQ